MATVQNTTRWLRRGAFAAGLVAALTLVMIGRIPAGTAPIGLDATLTTGPSGEVAVSPAGTVARATALAPGRGELHGTVALTNQTDAALAVHVRMRPSIPDADAALQVQVQGPRGTLYAGPAGGLREPSAAHLTISPHGSAAIAVIARVAPGAGAGWRAREVTLPLEYVSTIAGRARR